MCKFPASSSSRISSRQPRNNSSSKQSTTKTLLLRHKLVRHTGFQHCCCVYSHRLLYVCRSTGRLPWSQVVARRVQHYGFAFDYVNRRVDPDRPLGPLPGMFSVTSLFRCSCSVGTDCNMLVHIVVSAFCDTVLARMRERVSVTDDPGCAASLRDSVPIASRGDVKLPAPFVPDQLTINEYPPGKGIARHVDTHSPFGPVIASLSLLTDTLMEFREFPRAEVKDESVSMDADSKTAHPADAKAQHSEDSGFVRKWVHLPRRSLLVMDGEVRRMAMTDPWNNVGSDACHIVTGSIRVGTWYSLPSA